MLREKHSKKVSNSHYRECPIQTAGFTRGNIGVVGRGGLYYHCPPSWSSVRVFQTSVEGPRRSGGCLNHSTNAGCWQATPVTIQGRKCTPRALPLARITSGVTDEGRSVGTSTIKPRTTACMGGGLGQCCPHERLEVPPGVVLSKGSHKEPTHVGIRQDHRVQDADEPDGG